MVYVEVVMKFYKIRSKKNPELYRLGGVDSRWNKSGKTWDTLGKLRSMITNTINNQYRSEELSDWEIVEYEVTEVSAKPLNEVMSAENLKKLLTSA